jgi:type VI secretion system protein ImpG
MRDELFRYYDRELQFIRKMVWAFAEKYPEVAGRLLLEPNKSEDPHVERLIEAFAMMAARIQIRLDDDFSEVSDALLGVLYPHFLNPVPSLTIVQLGLEAQLGKGREGVRIERGSLLNSRPVEGVRCRFTTCYDVQLWPLELASVEIAPPPALPGTPREARSALRLRLRAQSGASLEGLDVDRLAFFLDGLPALVDALYRMFARDAVGLLVQRGAAPPAWLPASCIRPMGFAANEALLAYPRESFLGYRLLQEYFAFEPKFHFVEISGLPTTPAGPHDTLEISLLLQTPLAEVTARPAPENLRIGCTPAVNLFQRTADPILVSEFSVEYPVVPDARAPLSYEVHSIASVTSAIPGSVDVKQYHPFYGVRHGARRDAQPAYWHARRRQSLRKDDLGTDVALSVVDRDFQTVQPDAEVLTVRTLCSNRDLPARLPFGDASDFHLEARPEISSIRCLRKPTAPIRAPLGGGARWRLISHLALNHLSIADVALRDAPRSEDAAEQDLALDALREILKLYDFSDNAITRQRIGALTGLRGRRVVRRVGPGAFARGVELELEVDEASFSGGGGFLFASVLERFLGLYTSVNSFTQTLARSRQGGGVMKRWAPRAGEIQLL